MPNCIYSHSFKKNNQESKIKNERNILPVQKIDLDHKIQATKGSIKSSENMSIHSGNLINKVNKEINVINFENY